MPTGPEAVAARHRAQCRICRHAQRGAIEQEFLDWVPAREIAEEYKLGSHRAVYRHAHALALFRARRGYIERALDNIIERSGEAKITAASVVSAIRMMVEINMPEKQFLLELLQGSAGWVFAKNTPKPWEAVRVAEADDAADDFASVRLAAAPPPQAAPALKPPATAAPPRPKLAMPPDPPREKSECKAAPTACAAKEGGAERKAEPPKPPAPASPAASADPAPARVPAVPEPGTRREPDGPPQVAGMAWPWAKGNSPFARRTRWRRRPVVG
jgi:hypothetical protein